MMDWRPFVYGGLASVIAETGTFPIDTTRVLLQLQGEYSCLGVRGVESKRYYRGMLHAGYSIVKAEGIAALYRGLPAALVRQASYGTIKMGMYKCLKRFLSENVSGETYRKDVFAAVAAGALSSAIANPTDVIKVRMQSQSSQFRDMSFLKAFRIIATQEGLRGLWRGVVPTAVRAGIMCGVELPLYDLLKRYILRKALMEDDKYLHFLCSFCTGFCGTLAMNPVDIVKTRMMNQRNLKRNRLTNSPQQIYANSIQCFVQTLRTGGITALWRGFIPNWLRSGPWCIIFFMSYEQLQILDKKLQKTLF